VFETSTINQRIAGIPVITIIGVVSFAAQAFMAWVFLRDPSAGLYGKPRMVVFNIVVFLSGLVIYYIAKAVRSRQGIDVSLSFKEIPEE
jgi:uncharacterized membrane protein